MQRIFTFFLCFFLITILNTVLGQDLMLKLNGKEIKDVKVLDITANTIQFQEFGKENGRKKSIYRDNVFHIVYANGTEKVTYLPDPTDKEEYTIEQMRMFILGVRDSRKVYHHIPSFAVGLIAGVAGPFFANYTLGPLIALPPALGTLVASIGSPNMNKQKVDPKFLNNEEYMMGYSHQARKKKIRNAFLSSLVGVAAGLVLVKMVPEP